MYQLCPKCNGQGTVSKPPWIDGDINTWTDSQVGGYTCNLCGGKKVIECPPPNPTLEMLAVKRNYE